MTTIKMRLSQFAGVIASIVIVSLAMRLRNALIDLNQCQVQNRSFWINGSSRDLLPCLKWLIDLIA